MGPSATILPPDAARPNNTVKETAFSGSGGRMPEKAVKRAWSGSARARSEREANWDKLDGDEAYGLDERTLLVGFVREFDTGSENCRRPVTRR